MKVAARMNHLRMTLWLVGMLLMAATCMSDSCAAAGQKPNVVIIYGDDVGYADVGAYGSKLIPTPNIAR